MTRANPSEFGKLDLEFECTLGRQLRKRSRQAEEDTEATLDIEQ